MYSTSTNKIKSTCFILNYTYKFAAFFSTCCVIHLILFWLSGNHTQCKFYSLLDAKNRDFCKSSTHSLKSSTYYLCRIFSKISGNFFGIGKDGLLIAVKTIICNRTPNCLGVNATSVLILQRIVNLYKLLFFDFVPEELECSFSRTLS